MRLLRLQSLAACVAALTLAVSAFAADTITLRKSVRLASNAGILLSDVAELDGAAKQYASVEVGRTDTGAFELPVDALRQRLVAAGATLGSIKFSGDRVVVRPVRVATTPTTTLTALPEEPVVRVRTAMEVTRRAEPKLIEPAQFANELTPLGIASNLIGNAFGGDLANVRLAIREDDLAKLAVKPGLRYEIAAKTALRTDRVDLEVIAYEGTKLVSRDRVRIEPRLAREVVTIACDVRRGESLDATNSTIETRFIAPSACERAADATTTLGTRSVKQLSAGAVVATDDIERPLAVRRNERIMVRREVGMVAIEFEAVALEDGVAGDVIAVEQAAKGRRRDAQALSAEVIAPGRVVVR